MDHAALSILAGWIGMLLGAISGAGIGLFFHQEGWMGGYGSFRRRMLRLGHIAFFGLGFLNIMYGLTVKTLSLPLWSIEISSFGFLVAAIAMPLCCFLTAWNPLGRYLFPIPVTGVLLGVMSLLMGWSTR